MILVFFNVVYFVRFRCKCCVFSVVLFFGFGRFGEGKWGWWNELVILGVFFFGGLGSVCVLFWGY